MAQGLRYVAAAWPVVARPALCSPRCRARTSTRARHACARCRRRARVEPSSRSRLLPTAGCFSRISLGLPLSPTLICALILTLPPLPLPPSPLTNPLSPLPSPTARIPTLIPTLTSLAQMRLYLVRHGQTDWNVEGRIQGRTDNLLNPAGQQQALALASFLSQVSRSCQFASPTPYPLPVTVHPSPDQRPHCRRHHHPRHHAHHKTLSHSHPLPLLHPHLPLRFHPRFRPHSRCRSISSSPRRSTAPLPPPTRSRQRTRARCVLLTRASRRCPSGRFICSIASTLGVAGPPGGWSSSECVWRRPALE